MTDRIKTLGLMALCVAGACLAGCFPEDSVEWSADGSAGLYRVEEALYLIDGQSGALTQIEPDGVGIMPCVSEDGRLIAYVKDVACANLDDGLQRFPKTVVRNIREQARQLGERILAGHESVPDDGMEIGLAEGYRSWVIRCICESADAPLREKIGSQKLAELKTNELHYNELILARREDLAGKKVIVTVPGLLFRPRFSPDGRHVAYLMPSSQDDEAGVLLLASADGKTDAVEVARGVAIGYDWRPDGKALAYVKRDGDPLLGVLEEKVVIGDDGIPFAKPIDAAKEDSVGTSKATRQAEQFVGTLFQPTMHVEYGLDGRVILSSAAGAIPTAKLDDPEYSLFCYDRVMGTVTNILPGVLRSQASQNMNFFRLSPDGKRLLVPLKEHRFAVYELGSNEAVFPIEPNEGFGSDEMPDFVPTWKGNNHITCLVSEKSHFLAGHEGQPARRKEIVVIDTAGQLRSVLSKDWPDEAIP